MAMILAMLLMLMILVSYCKCYHIMGLIMQMPWIRELNLFTVFRIPMVDSLHSIRVRWERILYINMHSK